MTRPKSTASSACHKDRGRGCTIARFTRKTTQRKIQPFVRHVWRTQTHVRLDVRRGIGTRMIWNPSRSLALHLFRRGHRGSGHDRHVVAGTDERRSLAEDARIVPAVVVDEHHGADSSEAADLADRTCSADRRRDDGRGRATAGSLRGRRLRRDALERARPPASDPVRQAPSARQSPPPPPPTPSGPAGRGRVRRATRPRAGRRPNRSGRRRRAVAPQGRSGTRGAR